MALLKNHNTLIGITLNIFRLQPGRIDPLAREASFVVSGYASTAVPVGRPTVPIFAKLRLCGAAFDAVLGKPALAASAEQGIDLYGALYLALKSPDRRSDEVICDAGHQFFADAVSDE